jgi:catechol 2,3-dioxygenase-like lactoylglutathione lyase family enzyme
MWPVYSAMIRYKEIGFIAYPVTSMARARKFYEGVLGLKSNGFSSGQGKFIEYKVGTSTLAIGSSPLWKPSKHGPTAALEVRDFDAAVAHLKQHRVKFVLGPAEGPRCWMVAVRDPDGNKITLHRRKRRT